MNREIKFKVFHKGSITERIKIDGYERINGNRWEWMSLELNPDNWFDRVGRQLQYVEDKHKRQGLYGVWIPHIRDSSSASCKNYWKHFRES